MATVISTNNKSFPFTRAAVPTACHFKMASSYQDCVCHFVNELPNFDIDLFPEREEEEYPGRFLSVTDSDVDMLIEGEENTKTTRKTHYDLNMVNKFLVEEHSETREIEQIPPTELNNYLSQFVLAART